ncbi:alpha/beta fold hydrolase [Kocuria marina]|uniref:alpha/beta fold hydrolase n=1 Tax=Kocuria marina TaxID=223184 RepID=UPI003B3AFF8D
MSSRNRGVAHRRGRCARRPAVALTGTRNEKDNGSAPSGIGEHVSTREVLGGPVRILDVGSGPVIVCCSGVASTLWDWLPVVERLRRDHRVIVYDRPGYAPGDRVSEQLPDLNAEADRFAAVLAACGVREPVTAVGHSFGGAVVEVAARVHPERIRHLVLLDASVPSAEGADPAHDQAATARRFRQFTLPLARSRGGCRVACGGPRRGRATRARTRAPHAFVAATARGPGVPELPHGLPAGTRGVRGMHEPVAGTGRPHAPGPGRPGGGRERTTAADRDHPVGAPRARPGHLPAPGSTRAHDRAAAQRPLRHGGPPRADRRGDRIRQIRCSSRARLTAAVRLSTPSLS